MPKIEIVFHFDLKKHFVQSNLSFLSTQSSTRTPLREPGFVASANASSQADFPSPVVFGRLAAAVLFLELDAIVRGGTLPQGK